MDSEKIILALNNATSGGPLSEDFVCIVDGKRTPESWDDPSEAFYFWYNKQTTCEVLGKPAKIVEEVGGEGEGEHYHIVVSVGDKFFMRQGSYDSWEGVEWGYGEDSWVEVFPEQVMTTVYRKEVK